MLYTDENKNKTAYKLNYNKLKIIILKSRSFTIVMLFTIFHTPVFKELNGNGYYDV